MTIVRCFFATSLMLLWISNARSQSVLVGPMIGHLASSECTIWVQTDVPASVTVELIETKTGTRTRTNPVKTTQHYVHTAHVVCGMLSPGTEYTYRVFVNDVASKNSYAFTTWPVWNWQTSPMPSATMCFGSCFYVNQDGYERSTGGYGVNNSMIQSIVNQKPNVMLWLGDNVYLRDPDWTSPSGMLQRWAHTRGASQLAPLLPACAHYATWDDHDYGPNDSDESWVLKNTSLELFKQFWANPSYGTPEQLGTFTRFEMLDVEVFILDDRWYRTASKRVDSPGMTRTILGDYQKNWLINALVSSTATFKVIAVGSQFLTDNLRKECFSRVPEERDWIISEITKNAISGVVFLSGDIHSCEANMLQRDSTYPLWEFTSSPLTAGVYTPGPTQPNSYRVQGSAFAVHNAGKLTVQGNRKNRELVIEFFDENGKGLWQHVISEQQLR
jgi:alkaline phosphatase D